MGANPTRINGYNRRLNISIRFFKFLSGYSKFLSGYFTFIQGYFNLYSATSHLSRLLHIDNLVKLHLEGCGDVIIQNIFGNLLIVTAPDGIYEKFGSGIV